jgi:hypothetical protein
MARGRGGHPLIAVDTQALPDRRRRQPPATGTRARAARQRAAPQADRPRRRPAARTGDPSGQARRRRGPRRRYRAQAVIPLVIATLATGHRWVRLRWSNWLATAARATPAWVHGLVDHGQQQGDRCGRGDPRQPAPAGRRQRPGRGEQQGEWVAGDRRDDGGGRVRGRPDRRRDASIGHPVVGGRHGHPGRAERQAKGQQQPAHRMRRAAGGHQRPDCRRAHRPEQVPEALGTAGRLAGWQGAGPMGRVMP